LLLSLAICSGSLPACHSRSEEEVGAAPDRGDSTTVTASDTTQAGEIGDRIPMDSARVGDTTGYKP
jgi:hypothetical protein